MLVSRKPWVKQTELILDEAFLFGGILEDLEDATISDRRRDREQKMTLVKY